MLTNVSPSWMVYGRPVRVATAPPPLPPVECDGLPLSRGRASGGVGAERGCVGVVVCAGDVPAGRFRSPVYTTLWSG